nr:hypothetical protein [Nostoc sp. ZfuVER08]
MATDKAPSRATALLSHCVGKRVALSQGFLGWELCKRRQRTNDAIDRHARPSQL